MRRSHAEPDVAGETQSGSRHILLAEDDAGLLSSLSFLLRNEGHRVTTAVDGLDALDRYEEFLEHGEPVDMLITDIQMPRMNGMRLIQSLTATAGNDLPIIVITGHGDKDMVVELMRIGCDDFLDKPFEPEDVRHKVNEVMERKRLRELAKADRLGEAMAREQDMAQAASDYKRRFESLHGQVQRAVGAYQDLISLKKEGYRVGVAFRHRPLHDLGGDYLDVCDTDKGTDLIVADVAGHDLAASYQTILVKAYFQENCQRRKDGRGFFELLNHDLSEGGTNERMITAVLLSLDLEKQEAQVVTAGHPKVIRFCAADQVARRVPGRGSPLGLSADARFASTSLPLASGDRLFLYTDGVAGARRIDGPSGMRSSLGEEGLVQLINSTAGLTLDEQVARIMEGVQRFSRYKQIDDMLLCGVEIPDL